MADFDPDSVLTSPHPDRASMRVRPKLSRDDLTKLVRKYNPDITDAAVQGEVDNIERESSGVSSNDTGDGGTSGGLYQHHNSRLTNLKDYAAKHDKDWRDPEIQVQFSRLEKEKDYPKLLAFQQSNTDRSANEDAFKRIFERPASVFWQNNAEGHPVTDSPRFKFSDYAMKEFMGQPDTDIRYMDPKEYLQLTPPLEGKPFESPSGRSLKKSLDRGDQVEQIPSLDVSVDGPTAQVTDQDGRHRMLAAQEAGLQAVPVAVKGLKGSPTEIVGMDGVPQAFDHPRQPRQEAPEPQKEPISLLRQIGDAIVPRAEAAEPGENPYAKYAKPQENPYAKYANQSAGNNTGGTTEITPEQAEFARQYPERMFPPSDASPTDQAKWIDARQSQFGINNEIPAAITRGAAPYVAGAGTGAAVGGAVAGPPGALVGAGIGGASVGAADLIRGLSGGPRPQDATNQLLDLTGMRRPESATGRIIEQAAGGAANALSGAEGLGLLGAVMKTPASKVTANYLTKLASRVTDALAANPAAQTTSGLFSGAGSQGAAEAGLPPGLQWLAGLAAGILPAHHVVAPNIGKIDPIPLAKKAIEKGFKLHPADASAQHVGRINLASAAAAEAGKVKVNQQASMYNSVVANFLSQEEIGLPRGQTLTPAAFEKAKQPPGAVFREIEKAVPEVDLARSPEFTRFVQTLGGRSAETERLFPEMAGTPEILELRDQLLRNERAATPSVMAKIADLRKQAAANFQKDGDAQAHRLAGAQRQAAQAMEEAMEDSVKNAPRYFQEKVNEARAVRAEATADFDYINRSAISDPLSPMGKQLEQARRRVEAANADTKKWEDQLAEAQNNNAYYQGLPDKFRQARQLFAKIFDLQSVTNKTTGDVNPRGLAKLLEHGKPLTGNLKLIADLANTFSKAFQNPKMIGGVESMSVLDVGAATLSALDLLLHGHPIGAAIAALSPGVRPLTRDRVLSDRWQRGMIQPHQTPSLPLSALTTPMLPTQPVPGNPGGNALMGLTTQQ